MIDYPHFCQIKHLHEHQGLNASQIAQTVSLDRRTVAYWLTQEHFHPRKPRPHASKLDPFKPAIVHLLERYPYSAAQVFQRLREHGFDGSYGLVKAYVRTVRPSGSLRWQGVVRGGTPSLTRVLGREDPVTQLRCQAA